MRPRDVEHKLRDRLGLSRAQACTIVSKGRRWLWLSRISVELFAHFTVWRIGKP